MADSQVNVKDAADSTIPVDSRTNSSGQQRQVVVPGGDGDYFAGVTPFGRLNVSLDATALFYDGWNGAALDTTDRWTLTGPAVTISGGGMSMSGTASTTTSLVSKPTFPIQTSMYLAANTIVQSEAGTGTGAGRFWGLASGVSQTPGDASLVQEGAGFETDLATGALLAVTYTGGVRTSHGTITPGATIATGTIPNFRDGLPHRYSIIFRQTRVWWFVDGMDAHVATVAYPSFVTQDFGWAIVRRNAATYGGTTPVFSNLAVGAGDMSRNSTQLSDGTFAWRKAKIGPTGDISVSMTSPGVAALGITAGLTAYGNQRVTMEPTLLFNDPFDTAVGVDTTHRWNSGGTVPPTIGTGNVLVHANNAANASSSLSSKPIFPPVGLGFLATGWIGRFENNTAASGATFFLNSHRYLGLATIPATWTATYSGSATSGPVLSGVGFEIDTDGLMYPVLYDNGVRTRPALLTGAANLNTGRTLANGEVHQFLVVSRSDSFFWYVDGTETPVATYNYRTTGYSVPDVASLPLRFHTINSATAPSGTMVHRIGAVGVGDTGRNSTTIGDAVHPWRRASVSDPAAFTAPPATPPNTSTGMALNVNPNALQKRTYRLYRAPVSGTAAAATVTVANTAKQLLTFWHAATSTTTKRVRRITVSAVLGQAANTHYEVYRTVTAPAGGTALASSAVDTSEAASSLSAVWLTTSANTVLVLPALGGTSIVSTTTGHPDVILYDWQESGETKPLTLRPGVLEGYVITVRMVGTAGPDPAITVTYTEE